MPAGYCAAARDGRGRGGDLRPQSNGVGRQLCCDAANAFDIIKDTADVYQSAEITQTITIPTRVDFGVAVGGRLVLGGGAV